MTPPNNDELQKAVEHAERLKAKLPLAWHEHLGLYFSEDLLSAAKQLSAAQKDNRCKTCVHFNPVYPYNEQLGNCEYLAVFDNQPCGHTISGRSVASSVFVKDKSRLPACVNRVMDDFGCVYHHEKLTPTTATDNSKDVK